MDYHKYSLDYHRHHVQCHLAEAIYLSITVLNSLVLTYVAANTSTRHISYRHVLLYTHYASKKICHTRCSIARKDNSWHWTCGKMNIISNIPLTASSQQKGLTNLSNRITFRSSICLLNSHGVASRTKALDMIALLNLLRKVYVDWDIF